MRLSEAIRLGAAMKPQAFDGNQTDATCALRAAAEACGISDVYNRAVNAFFLNYPELREAFPLLDMHVRCPEHCPMADAALRVIYHLNDEHRWSREQIADFVELHEPMPAPLPEQVEVLA